MRKFPQDCPISCPHYRRYDMSVDDYTNICHKLGKQVNDCDEDFAWEYCPLDKEEEGSNENVYLATLRRSRIDRSEVTQAIGVFSTPEYARAALDEAVTEFYDYSVIHVSEEENGFIFYFVRHEDLMGADVCTGKITEIEVGFTYFNDDHL